MGKGLKTKAPVGIFDSGLGGLTVAKEIQKLLPNESIIYYGDTARVPYGSKSKDTIIKFTREAVNFLQSHNAKCIVVACNTASALALPPLNITPSGVSTHRRTTRPGSCACRSCWMTSSAARPTGGCARPIAR